MGSRLRPRERYYLAGLLLALFVVAFASRLGDTTGWEFVEPLTMLAVCVVLTWIFPEPFRGLGWDARALKWMAIAVAALCVIWTLGFWIWNSHSTQIQWGWRLVLHFLFLAVISPWFEEKVLRHLLLGSILKVARPFVSIIFVSVLFALAHKGMFSWALIASLVLCLMRVKLDAKTIHCVVVHGLVNSYVFALYVTT